MTLMEELRLLQNIHRLIAIKGTGSVVELTRRYRISRATVLRKINLLRSMGANVYFCRQRNSYCYREKFELNFESIIL